MSEWPKFRIEATPGGFGSKVFVDNEELHHVRSVTIRLEAGEATTVTVEQFANAHVEVIDSKFRHHYVRWWHWRFWRYQIGVHMPHPIRRWRARHKIALPE